MKNSRKTEGILRRLKELAGTPTVWVALLALSLCGCATVNKTTRKIARDLNPAKGSLKIRMALLPIADKASLETGVLETGFEKPLIQALRRKCSSVVLDTGIHLSGSEKTQAPSAAPTGPPDAFVLSETGRHHGFNALAVVGLQSLGARMEQRGILWFKGDRHLLQAHADAEVYDTLTGSKALSRDFYFETQVDEATYQQIQTGKGAQLPQVRTALLKIAEEMAGAICEAVDALFWRGFIVSVNEDVVFLSSGKRTGLKDHTVLTVFDQGQIVQGTGGQRFILPGKPKGRIQVVALQPNACEAKVLSGGPFVKGDFVEVE